MTALVIEAALRGLVLASVVGLGLTVLRVRNVPARKTAWSVVLIASLAMPLLVRWSAGLPGRFAWVVPVGRIAHLEALARPAAVHRGAADVKVESAAAASVPAGTKGPAVSALVADEDTPATSGGVVQRVQLPPTATLLVWAYLAGCGALLLRLVYGLLVALHLWATAERVSPLIAPEGYVRASSRIASPVTIGSGIVLPADYREWSRSKMQMVLGHEQSHVRQLDFYLQLLAGVYTALFWFSPLGWVLRRRLAALGETIADRAGAEAGKSRTGYAEVVLEFAAMPRRNLQGVAMACSANLSRRMESMLNERAFRRAFAEGRRRAGVALVLIPAVIFAVAALVRTPAADAAAQAAAPAGQSAPAAAQADQQTVAPASAKSTESGSGSGAGQGRGEGRSGDASGNPALHTRGHKSGAYVYHTSGDADSWAIVRGPESSMNFSGRWDSDQRAEIEAARRMAHGPFLWFRHNGQSYVLDDPSVVARIEEMQKPMEELGRQQAALGKQQEELGRRMQALADAQKDAGDIRMPDLSREMAGVKEALDALKLDQVQWNEDAFNALQSTLKANQGQLISPEKMAEIQEKVAEIQAKLTSEKMAEFQAKMAAMQAKLGALQGEMGARQGSFGAKMGALGAQHGVLGVQQGRLGAEQGRLAQEMDQKVRSIIEEALRSGTAKQVK